MSEILFCFSILLTIFSGGCATDAATGGTAGNSATSTSNAANTEVATTAPPASINIVPGSPADIVRAFYTKLREKKFREAIYLTNLRPAVEGLTDSELKEFQVDFERIAKAIPANVTINGEIVSGNRATVTASLPGEDPEKLETQQIELRKDGDNWVLLTIDEAAEARIKKEGKNYFYVLRIETHEDEARDMLDRVAKAQLAYSVQNGGNFAEMPALIQAELLPDDILTSESTGYNYKVTLTPDKKTWQAWATPAEYGKSGKLSFVLQSDGRSTPKISSKDNGGKPLEVAK